MVLMGIFRRQPPYLSLSLRWVMIAPFMVTTIITVGMVGYLSYRIGQMGLEKLANQVSDQAASRVKDHLDNTLENQHQPVVTIQNAIENGSLNVNNFEEMRTQFWQSISLSPSLGAIYFGSEMGAMIGYIRLLSQEGIDQTKQITGKQFALGQVYLIESNVADINTRNYYLINNQGKREQNFRSLKIDNRTTPWYLAGKEAESLTWSPVYVYRDAPTLGINAIAPIKDAKGKLQGVLGNSVRLTAISTFLNQLNFSRSGQAFVIERSGYLVATSTLETPFVQNAAGGEPSRLAASQSQNATTKLVAAQLQQQYGSNLSQIQTKTSLKIKNMGNALFVDVLPYKDEYGLDWLLVTVIPEADFTTSEIQENIRWAFLVIVFVLVAVITAGIYIARWISRPIVRLSRVSKAMARGDRQPPLPENQAIAELQTLSVTFNLMAEAFYKSLDEAGIELKENKQFIQQITDCSPQILYVLDLRTWTNLYVSPQCIDILGYTPEEFQKGGSEMISGFIHPDDLPHVVAKMDKWETSKEGQAFSNEYRMRHKNGDWIWLRSREVVFARDENNQVTKILGTAQDINDQKQVEIERAEKKEIELKQSILEEYNFTLTSVNQELQNNIEEMKALEEEIRIQNIEIQSERLRYQNLFDFAPDSYLITDISGQIHEANQAVIELLAIKREFLLGKPFFTFITLEELDVFYAKLNSFRSYPMGRRAVWEFTLKPRTGEPFLAEISVIQNRNTEDNQPQLCWFIRDVSLRKQAQMAIAAKEAAEASTKAKSEFLANMSHEIRTPMNGVLGMAQMLATTNLTEKQRRFVKIITESGDSLLTVINDILDFSKIEAGIIEIDQECFVLEEVISAVHQLLDLQAKDKSVCLKYTIDSSTPAIVISDRARLRQILLNLVGNAVKFTTQGQVSLSVSSRLLPDSNKYELKFAIADTGIGIKGDKITGLFQPFTQADTSINRQYGGTGLGLAICKRLIELMGGTIWVESFGKVGGTPTLDWKPDLADSSVSQGSTFHFVIISSQSSPLPQSQEFLSPESLSTESITETASVDETIMEKFPLRILLVEDNKVNQLLANLMLKRLGYQVDFANDGLEAVQAVQDQSYDLILMDVRMPKMDGLAATRLIRKSMNQVRIVAITADARPEDRQACLDAGMNDFIAKPVDIQELIRIVSSQN